MNYNILTDWLAGWASETVKHHISKKQTCSVTSYNMLAISLHSGKFHYFLSNAFIRILCTFSAIALARSNVFSPCEPVCLHSKKNARRIAQRRWSWKCTRSRIYHIQIIVLRFHNCWCCECCCCCFGCSTIECTVKASLSLYPVKENALK